MRRRNFLALLVGAPIAAKLLPEPEVPKTVTIPAMTLESTTVDAIEIQKRMNRLDAELFRRMPIHPAHARVLERIGYPYP
jgi:hypothetical protein